MDKLLGGLTDFNTDHLRKRNEKFWGEITFPFSLEEGLGAYAKHELDDIRKKLDIKGVSSLKKADLINVLQEIIPNKLEGIYRIWDSERLSLLFKIADNGGKMTAPSSVGMDQATYFRNTGFIFTGSYQGKEIVAVPNDLIDRIKAMKNDLNVRATAKRNSEWLTLSRGLLYYYGTLNSSQLIEMVQTYSKETVEVRDFFQVIFDANEYMEDFQVGGYGFSDQAVVEPQSVVEEQEKRKDVPFYPFSKQQLLKAGEHEFIEKNDSYHQMVQYFTRNFDISKEEADDIVEDSVYDIQNGSGPNELLENFNMEFELVGLDEIQALMDRVVDLMNNTRQWVLKGHSPNELGQKERKHLQPLPSTPYKSDEPAKSVKVGRNDPCPCGSGKKYKKCCGK
ncbi:hypothetical protein GH741_02830 [Aquibacillus halophilus]|uniref:SEC-C domain-containing protein n=2 Tax=Aquibacillus halophilus TaxID=930132 RepID=A0A6A8DAL9_9BACI|nr:hypothetical protein [Aquibacillus halophilus]